MATQQADGSETEALAGGGQGMEVVGVIAAEADQPGGARGVGVQQVVAQLEPFVAADQGVDQVQAQDGGFNVGTFQPSKLEGL
ncbi:hypothetical protein D3C79_671670 [compost metagenome]